MAAPSSSFLPCPARPSTVVRVTQLLAFALLLSACAGGSESSVDKLPVEEGEDSGGEDGATDESGAEGSAGGGADGATDSGADGGSDTGAPPAPCAAPEGGLWPLAPEGALLDQGRPVDGLRPPCAAAVHAGAGAAGSRVSVQLQEADVAHWVRAVGLDGAELLAPTRMTPGMAISVPLTQSGEFFVELHPTEAERPDAPPSAYRLGLECADSCAEYTRYPILFMHGMAGTETFVGVLDYWFGVQDELSAVGFLSFTPAVDALAGVAPRAEQWLAHLDALTAEGRARRVNIIAHSQGGVDARLLTSALDVEGRVASLTTVATPHRGAALADLTSGVLDLGPFDGALVDAALEGLTGLIGLDGPSLSAQMRDLRRDQMEAFNAEVLDRPGVLYFSWSSKSCSVLDFGCQRDNNGEIIEGAFEATLAIVNLTEGDNDGVVGAESAVWGTHLGQLTADHLDEIGQIADLRNRSFDHRAFYLAEARRLAALGL
jgi:triacylglycerol esterase/lipase EstA (alpha/beta hydrolase family)